MTDGRRRPTTLERAGFIAHKAPTWFTAGALIFLADGRKSRWAALRGWGLLGAGRRGRQRCPQTARSSPKAAARPMVTPLAGDVLVPVGAMPRPSWPSPSVWRHDLPILIPALGATLALGHWSMVERGSHYRSDVVAGGVSASRRRGR
jgi:hypothetical protein